MSSSKQQSIRIPQGLYKKMLIATLTRGATIEIQGSTVADRVKYACQLLQVPIDDPDIQAMLEDITSRNYEI